MSDAIEEGVAVCRATDDMRDVAIVHFSRRRFMRQADRSSASGPTKLNLLNLTWLFVLNRLMWK